jgi:hypothetical protein
MSERTYAYFMALIGVVCAWVVIRWSFSHASLTLRNALVQGFFVGFRLAPVTIEIEGKGHEDQRLDHDFRMRRAGQWHVSAGRMRSDIYRPSKLTGRSDVLENAGG